jgi:hypothetical protein
VPGSSGATLTRSATAITITVGGEGGTLPTPPGAAVSACQAGALYVVRAVDPASPSGAPPAVELVVNADTRCLAANGVSVASIPGATSAERTGDPAFAATAGVPLPAGYTPPPPPPPPPAPLAAAIANPCIAPEAGQSVGLATAFWEAPYPADGGAKVAAALEFKGEAAFKRCGRGESGLGHARARTLSPRPLFALTHTFLRPSLFQQQLRLPQPQGLQHHLAWHPRPRPVPRLQLWRRPDRPVPCLPPGRRRGRRGARPLPHRLRLPPGLSAARWRGLAHRGRGCRVRGGAVRGGGGG